ncbi:hypothetical protein Micbo1qcDRAFT_209955 [Microdochium bolleyi]|uniref:Peptidase C1A papain C-terminal domain-containing protein n=1 Tax=Microdochium bolleyi TaxID=196109 RepID=A0A136IKS8_9PEZI|nr:hypothetical protein Micbo1qcDRAFT_209955 [Microdochium bolleyi]
MAIPTEWTPSTLLYQQDPLDTQFPMGSFYRPAMCEYNGRLFIAWATIPPYGPPPPSFSYTARNLTDDGWDERKIVNFPEITAHQTYGSCLVVFNNTLFALVPFDSGNGGGLGLFFYNGDSFSWIGQWSATWETDVVAVVANNVLHIIGHRTSDNALIWTYSLPGLLDLLQKGPPALPASQFSANTEVGESTTAAPALTVRPGGIVVALLLANTSGGGVLETTLDMTADPPVWNRTDDLDESGSTAVSAMTTPDGANSWISFKKHNGESSLLCAYKFGDGCYTSSPYSLGGDSPWRCYNPAALCWANGYVYTVWTDKGTYSPPMYWSRTAVASATDPEAAAPTNCSTQGSPVGTGFVSAPASGFDRRLDMSRQTNLTTNPKIAQPSYSMLNPQFVFDQGVIGSSAANAVAAAYRYLIAGMGKPDFVPSRMYLYYTARFGLAASAPDADYYTSLVNSPPTQVLTADSGATVLDTVRLMEGLGIVPEDTWPYKYTLATAAQNSSSSSNNIINNATAGQQFAPACLAATPPPTGCFPLAPVHQRTHYTITPKDEKAWKTCIAGGYPVVFGFTFYGSTASFAAGCWNRTDDNDIIFPVPGPTTETALARHAVLAVGWEDGLGCFRVQNSWGSNFGKQGCFLMSYAWLDVPGVVDDVCVTLLHSFDGFVGPL